MNTHKITRIRVSRSIENADGQTLLDAAADGFELALFVAVNTDVDKQPAEFP